MPATPRRPPLTSRPQGVYTLAPNLMHIDTDKSPSLALRSTNLPRSTHAKSLFPPASALPSSLKNAPLLFQAPSTAPARVPAHKRPRDDNQDELPTRNLKKSKLAAAIGYATPVKEKKVKHYTQEDKEDRLREINNFIDKYTRYFPTFTFYFDTLDSTRNAFAPKIRQLGGRVEEFFSASITHVITNKPHPKGDEVKKFQDNKENRSAAAPTATRLNSKPSTSTNPLRSPIKLKGLPGKSHETIDADPPAYDSLVIKAVQLGIKLWDVDKLDNVLMRLLQPPEKPKTTNAPAELSYLLERERQSGLTYERDPTALRTDFLYFGRNSYFLLVEDFTGEHCPIAVKDYGRWKGKDKERGEAPWPTLCDAPGRAKKGWAEGKVSDSTGDSEVEDIEYDDRTEGEIPHPEEGVEQEGEPDDDEVIVVPERGKETGLRRTASMHNMGRAAQLKRDAEFLEGLPTNKSFTQRAYAAASGNSVSITSNVNSTTSFPYLAPGLGPPQKGMTRKLHQQVLTHRTFSKMKEGEGEGDVEQEKGKESQLKKAAPVLRKSKSTNTVRLGFREETKKPGYCENCKYKFSDFKTHAKGSRHRRWAADESNFVALDDFLNKTQRKTIAEVEEIETAAWMDQEEEEREEAECGELDEHMS